MNSLLPSILHHGIFRAFQWPSFICSSMAIPGSLHPTVPLAGLPPPFDPLHPKLPYPPRTSALPLRDKPWTAEQLQRLGHFFTKGQWWRWKIEGVFPKIGPQNGWFIMENILSKWMIWGENPLFSETPIFFQTHVFGELMDSVFPPAGKLVFCHSGDSFGFLFIEPIALNCSRSFSLFQGFIPIIWLIVIQQLES